MRGNKILSAFVLVLIASGSALAMPRHMARPVLEMEGPGYGMHMKGHDRFGNMPSEIKAKLDQIRSTYAEIRTELAKEKPDSAKARGLHENILRLRGEIADYRLEELLKNAGSMRGMPERMGGWAARTSSEIHTLRTQMFEELKKEKTDTAKVREINGKIRTLTAAQSRERFEEILKSPSEFLNRQHHGFYNDGVRGGWSGQRQFSEVDRAKYEQLRNLHAEIRSEMLKTPRNETKLRELHKKLQDMRNEFSDSRFEEMLKTDVKP